MTDQELDKAFIEKLNKDGIERFYYYLETKNERAFRYLSVPIFITSLAILVLTNFSGISIFPIVLGIIGLGGIYSQLISTFFFYVPQRIRSPQTTWMKKEDSTRFENYRIGWFRWEVNAGHSYSACLKELGYTPNYINVQLMRAVRAEKRFLAKKNNAKLKEQKQIQAIKEKLTNQGTIRLSELEDTKDLDDALKAAIREVEQYLEKTSP